MLDMAKGRRAESEDGRTDLGVRDDLYTKHIGKAGSAIVSKGAEDEVLALLVEYQDAGEHFR